MLRHAECVFLMKSVCVVARECDVTKVCAVTRAYAVIRMCRVQVCAVCQMCAGCRVLLRVSCVQWVRTLQQRALGQDTAATYVGSGHCSNVRWVRTLQQCELVQDTAAVCAGITHNWEGISTVHIYIYSLYSMYQIKKLLICYIFYTVLLSIDALSIILSLFIILSL